MQEAMLIKPTSGGEVQVAGQRQADGGAKGDERKESDWALQITVPGASAPASGS